MNIQSLMLLKSSNLHMINRYLKFINYYSNQQTNEYTELHHILPKASDLFPEYIDIKEFPWNMIKLTARQHIIAHVMLWKIFGGSQTYALDCILGKFNSDTNAYLKGRKVPESFKIRYLAKLREDCKKIVSRNHKGKATFKDSQGNKFFLDNNDPLIKQLNLVGSNTGLKMSVEAKEKMRIAKLPYASYKLFFLNKTITIKKNDPKLPLYLDQGWTMEYLKSDQDYTQSLKKDKVSSKMKGKMRYTTVDGIYFGYFYKDDPQIEQNNLIPQVTENLRKSAKKSAEKAKEFNKGSVVYNNGLIEKKFKEGMEIPEGFVKGGLPYSIEKQDKIINAMKEKNKGSIYWNNGEVCVKHPKGVNPGEGWKQGMLPRKK